MVLLITTATGLGGKEEVVAMLIAHFHQHNLTGHLWTNPEGIPEQGWGMFPAASSAGWWQGVHKVGARRNPLNLKDCFSPSWYLSQAPWHVSTRLSHLLTSYSYLQNLICTTLQITSGFGPQFSPPLTNRPMCLATNGLTARVCHFERAALICVRF